MQTVIVASVKKTCLRWLCSLYDLMV